MKVIFCLFFTILFSIQLRAQNLPKEFSEDLSNWIRPMFTSHDSAVDMYAVAVVLSPKGKVVKTMFSKGTPDSVKSEITYRISIARIGLTPLSEYWSKFCSQSQILENTCIIQPVLVRFEDSDDKTFTVEEIITKFTQALTFDDLLVIFKEKLNVIWLKPKISRFVHNRIVN